MIETIERGATVLAVDDEVGVIEQVIADPATGAPTRLLIRTPDGRRIEAPYHLVAASSTARLVRLTAPASALVAAALDAGEERALEAVGDRLVVPAREEVLVPTKRPIELGTLRIHRRVETVPAETTVDVMREEVSVERVPLNQPVDAVPAPRHEGDTFVIPVVEEVLVTEKRLVLREEIRVTRRQVAEPVAVRDTVRREVVEIDDPTGGSQGVAEQAGTPTTSPAPGTTAGELPLT